MMVEMYTALPQHRYLGKYPQSIVSPQETGTTTPQPNGAEIDMMEVEKDQEDMHREDMQVESSPNRGLTISSPPHRQSSLSPVQTDRGRRPSKNVDSYRPSSRSRSRSRGGRQPPRTIDRYQPPDARRRDNFISHNVYSSTRSPPCKRPLDENTSPHRRKRKHSSDGEMSEGEIR